MSAKQQAAISNLMHLLKEWDKGSMSVRRDILNDFIFQHQNTTGTEIEEEFAHSASLFFTRITSWLRLTYMVGTCLSEQLKAVKIFLNTSSSNKFLSEFLEVGCLYTLLEIINLKQAAETNKTLALDILNCIANFGRNYKEIICECYGIRSIAECMAKSKSESTQIQANYLLENLAKGNPKFQMQVYKGLIALLPCSSPKAQELAAQTLKVVQPIVGESNQSLVEPLIALLQSLHIEVQYEAIELIKLLMDYNVKDPLIKSLVYILKPPKKLDQIKTEEKDAKIEFETGVVDFYVQQAAAAKTIGILVYLSNEIAEQFLSLQVVHNLLYAMGNEEYAESQRQASKTLEFFVKNFPIVADHVKEAMGDQFFEAFLTDPDGLYARMTAIQADVCRSNKVNIPYRSNA
ncbi:hypothetical protein BpHYR1_002495 [Brachionus plicatilis]|uniref:Armadillo-like helical domain containing 1 n=1 Tax=Brachionus plicatilis TaxID=10195 RepID=A0A3M7QS68_BRAPC|nr:hypothetical protein BpHYR1_002495 [Brachionus plicatilis]